MTMERRYHDPVDTDVLLLADNEQRIIVANKAVVTVFGYEIEEVVNRPVGFLFSVDSGEEEWGRGVPGLLARTGFLVRVGTARHRDGGSLAVEVVSSALPGSDRTAYLVRPVRARESAGDRDSVVSLTVGDAYERLFSGMSDAVLHLDMEWSIRGANRAAESLFGRPARELRGMSLIEIHPRESFERIFSFFRGVVRTGRNSLCGASVRRGDGAAAAVSMEGSLIRHEGSMLVQILYRQERGAGDEGAGGLNEASRASSSHDRPPSGLPRPADRQNTMEERPPAGGQEDSEALAALSEVSPELSWSVDMSLRITAVNSAFARLFFLMCGVQLREGESFPGYVDQSFRRAVARLFNSAVRGVCLPVEQMLGEGRTAVKLSIIAAPLHDSGGAVTGVAFYARTVEDSGERAAAATAVPGERDVLLKEVYHRVKNNLQLAASLLNFQSEYIKDPQYLEMFRESQNRIKSMALIHEKLYESGDLKSVDFGDYLRILINNLQWSYGASARGVRIRLDVGQVAIGAKAAVHCGLIINELVSNSFKHAFSGRTQGEISVSFRHDPAAGYTLSVSDDGTGFPEDLDFRNTKSLGMQLVVMLTDQLKGTITMDRSRGTGFTITFA